MKRPTLIISVLFLIIITTGATLFYMQDTDQSLSMQLTTANGRTIMIGDQQQGVILVNFWATTCRTCMKEMPHLIQLYQQLHAQGLEIIGVSVSYDPPSQVMEMVKNKKIPYPIVFDLDKKIQHGFGLKTPVTPATYVLDQHGKIVFQTLGMPDMEQLQSLIIKLLKTANKDSHYALG